MAHLGSRSAAWRKVWSACWYWKECKRAMPVSIRGWASAEQLVGKLTWPSWSVAGGWGWASKRAAQANPQTKMGNVAKPRMCRGVMIIISAPAWARGIWDRPNEVEFTAFPPVKRKKPMKTSKTSERGLRGLYVAGALLACAGAALCIPGWVRGDSAKPGKAAVASVEERRKQLSGLLAEHWEYTMRTNPEYASILGDKRYNDKSSDASEKAVYADLEEQKKFLKRFEAVDTSGFPEQEGLNKSLMVRNIRMQLEGAAFKEWEMPVSQFNGIHIDAPQLVSVLPFDTVKDYEDYITRLKNLPKQFDDTEDLMRKGVADHLVPPKILLEQVVKQAGT